MGSYATMLRNGVKWYVRNIITSGNSGSKCISPIQPGHQKDARIITSELLNIKNQEKQQLPETPKEPTYRHLLVRMGENFKKHRSKSNNI